MIRRSASKPDRLSVLLRRPRPRRGLMATGQLRCRTLKSREQSENVYENKGPLCKTREVGCRSEAAALLPNVPNPVSTWVRGGIYPAALQKSGDKARMSMKTKDRSANSRGRVPQRSCRFPSQCPQSCLDAIPKWQLPCRVPKIDRRTGNVCE